MPTQGTFDVKISLAKGIIFRKIGLANGAILKVWAAHPSPKFSGEPPPPRDWDLNSLRLTVLAAMSEDYTTAPQNLQERGFTRHKEDKERGLQKEDKERRLQFQIS